MTTLVGHTSVLQHSEKFFAPIGANQMAFPVAFFTTVRSSPA
jgi:hypothetical protein